MAKPNTSSTIAGVFVLMSMMLFAPVVQAEKGTPDLCVALLQMEPEGTNQQRNLEIADQYCRSAAQAGADIALMPEMWNTGYTRYDPDVPGEKEALFEQAVATESPFVQHFAQLAKELEMAIGVTYMQKWPGAPRNVITLFDRHGKEIYTYAKIHTSDFKTLETNMTPGEEFFVATLDTKSGPIEVGSMICFDREQPESARILMLKGAELILTPNSCFLDDIRIDQFKIRAVENALNVAMTNYPKPKNNGRSVAFSYDGRCKVEAGVREGLFLAHFGLEALREHRHKTIWGNAYRRSHRYQILSDPAQSKVWERQDGNGETWKMDQR